MHSFQRPFQNFIFYYLKKVNEKVIRKALWGIFVGVSEAGKLTTWKNPDCADLAWSRNTSETLYLVCWLLHVLGEKKMCASNKPNKEGNGTDHMLKNNYSFNFPTNEMWSFKDKM